MGLDIIDKLDRNKFIYYKNEPILNSKLGVTHNRIVEIPNFISATAAKSAIQYFEDTQGWGDIAFYGSFGKGIAGEDPRVKDYGLPSSFFADLRAKFKESVELVFERPVRPNTSHAQKWEVGGFAHPHSDNSDFEGNPTAFEINKYVGILYLNDDYEGGELYFPDHGIEFKPNSGSYYIFPGGAENIHGVREITAGSRHTMVAFWDFEEAEYSEERKAEWDAEFSRVREEQAEQRKQWESGNKWA